MNSDLVIVDGDLLLDGEGNPIFFNGKKVIEQSLRHRIFENNFLVHLIGERSPTNRATTFQQIKIKVEQDDRVVPGSCAVVHTEQGDLFVTAKSVDGDDLSLVYVVA
ncbi:MAG: DUF2590 family protein [Cycloclasticus sp.]|jgi:Protein of unknown function (DUF2590).